MLSKPTHRKHNPWHDYHEACIYHITLVCSDRVPVLGKIVGESVEKAHVVFTPLGKEVAHALQDIPYKEFHKGRALTRNEKISELENEQIGELANWRISKLEN